MKRMLSVLLILIVVLSLTACSTSANQPPPQTKDQEVTLYFANKAYVENGDEKLEKVKPEKRVLQPGDLPLEEAIVRALITGPESKDLQNGIPESVKLLDVKVSGSTALVNFAEEGLHGGSLQEGLTITQITRTLTELPNIEKVQFLVNGQKAESLMGHIDITEPFSS